MGNFANSKKKPEILSEEDTDQILSLFAQLQDGKPERLYTLKPSLKNLERSYELWEFNLDAFAQSNRKQYLAKFFNETPLHAGNAYLMLLFMVIAFTEGKQREYYLINYERYCFHLIEQLETSAATKKNVGFLNGAIEILFGLVVVASLIRDNQRLILAYRRLFKLATRFNIGDLHQRLFGRNFERRFPKLLSDYISDGLQLVESGHRIFGNSPYLIDAFLSALTYAQDDEPCLIIGETGTGKEIIARIIHRFSHRRDNNFQARNCGNFTETLFNSEIQGCHWSAATNVGTQLGVFLASCGRTENDVDLGYMLIDSRAAKGQKEISFARSNSSKTQTPSEEELHQFSGTVFLDEINSLPLELQSKLLRIIEQKEVNVLGEAKPRRFKAKIICATNQDPRIDHEGNVLRRDLFYRVGRGIVELPPLRNMRESIPELALHLIKEDSINVGIGIKARNLIKISDEAIDMLIRYDWPGNIREFENVLYRSLKRMTMEKARLLESRHLAFMVPSFKDQTKLTLNETDKGSKNWTNVKFAEHESFYMEELFRVTNGIVLQASKRSGRGRTAVKNSWIKLGLK